jgi:hypothetical protein
MPSSGPNDLFSSINAGNKWAFLLEYLKKDPKNETLVNTVKARNEGKFSKLNEERNQLKELKEIETKKMKMFNRRN